MIRGCITYHGIVLNVLVQLSRKSQCDYGAKLYSEGNTMIIFVPISDV
jgi:hypothetical protein